MFGAVLSLQQRMKDVSEHNRRLKRSLEKMKLSDVGYVSINEAILTKELSDPKKPF